MWCVQVIRRMCGLWWWRTCSPLAWSSITSSTWRGQPMAGRPVRRSERRRIPPLRWILVNSNPDPGPRFLDPDPTSLILQKKRKGFHKVWAWFGMYQVYFLGLLYWYPVPVPFLLEPEPPFKFRARLRSKRPAVAGSNSPSSLFCYAVPV